MPPTPPPLPSIAREPRGLVIERMRFWSGLDCDCEWFDVDSLGLTEAGIAGVSVRVDRSTVFAVAETEEVRLRVVLRIDPPGALLSVRSTLVPESTVLVRDAFATEVAQSIGGMGALRLPLAVGRFSVEAVLLPGSSVEIAEERGGDDARPGPCSVAPTA
ncbi:MAG: hypothetical protein RI967_283 [Planctomycetota bacterium]|jgi:hypothetical protein